MTRSPKRVIVAVNPSASFGRHRDVGATAVARLAESGHEVTLLQEANFELLRRETEHAFERGTDAVLVVGGDGMVSLAVNIVAGTGVPFGVVAAGTGNDLARGLGLPFEDPLAGIEALIEALEREPRTIDAGVIRRSDSAPVWFACIASAGFDALVNERANRMTRPRGPSRYTIALVRELATFRPRSYTITIDGVRREQKAMLVSVANGTSIGGGMKLVPHADLSDGRLDVLIVHPLSRARLIAVFPKVFRGEHTDHPAVEFVSAQRVTLDASDVVAYADGERVGALPIEVEVAPGVLRVFV